MKTHFATALLAAAEARNYYGRRGHSYAPFSGYDAAGSRAQYHDFNVGYLDYDPYYHDKVTTHFESDYSEEHLVVGHDSDYSSSFSTTDHYDESSGSHYNSLYSTNKSEFSDSSSDGGDYYLSISSEESYSSTYYKRSPTCARAVLYDAHYSGIRGSIDFKEPSIYDNDWKRGVKIFGDVYGLYPGKSAISIHEYGDTTFHCEKVGDRWDPYYAEHGHPDSHFEHNKAGDLGNLSADYHGDAIYLRWDKQVRLTGYDSVIDRSVVINLHEDDFESSDGDVGDRVACGWIQEVSCDSSASSSVSDSDEYYESYGSHHDEYSEKKKNKNRKTVLAAGYSPYGRRGTGHPIKYTSATYSRAGQHTKH